MTRPHPITNFLGWSLFLLGGWLASTGDDHPIVATLRTLEWAIDRRTLAESEAVIAPTLAR